MSIRSYNGTQIAFLSPAFTRRALCSPPYHQRRWRSFGSALHEGLRRDTERRENRVARDSRSTSRFPNAFIDRESSAREARLPRWRHREPERQEEQRFGNGSARTTTRSQRSTEPNVNSTKYPLSVPHTTASSEFLYGYNTVYAALRARKRTCYKLYVHSRGATRDEESKQQATVCSLARKGKISLVEGDAVDMRLLDKMSNGRPHNGIVLEASPIPVHTATSLAEYDSNKASPKFSVHRKNGVLQACKFTNQHPIILLIDDVLDAGNLGAILRSAYFLGIDAVVLTTHCAPLNAVALKASAGAAEALSLFRTDNPAGLLEGSAKAGWHSICAMTPGHWQVKSMVPLGIPARGVRYYIPAARDGEGVDAKLSRGPQIVVAGGEGQGLRKFITDKVDSFVEILPRDGDAATLVGLDSLNVSVAVAMVCNEVMTRMRVGVEQQGQGFSGTHLDADESLGFSIRSSIVSKVGTNMGEEERPAEDEESGRFRTIDGTTAVPNSSRAETKNKGGDGLNYPSALSGDQSVDAVLENLSLERQR